MGFNLLLSQQGPSGLFLSHRLESTLATQVTTWPCRPRPQVSGILSLTGLLPTICCTSPDTSSQASPWASQTSLQSLPREEVTHPFRPDGAGWGLAGMPGLGFLQDKPRSVPPLHAQAAGSPLPLQSCPAPTARTCGAAF